MKNKETCPNKSSHTESPEGYMDWVVWSGKMAKTHKQVKCKGCGLYVVWLPKRGKV